MLPAHSMTSMIPGEEEALSPVFPHGGERLLELRGLVKRFGSRRSTVEVLKGVDLNIHRGEVVALVGPSGSGKTTLLHLLAGLLPGDSGAGSFRGHPLPLVETHRGREGMSLVFQDPYEALSSHLRIRETVMEPLRIKGRLRDAHGKVCRALQAVRLNPPEAYLERYPGGLSGGQRQRVAIARALITDPVLLLADEPTSMLDASAGVDILNLFRDLAGQGMGVLLTIHDLATACYVADRLVVLFEGVMVEEGSPASILAQPRHDATRRLIAAAGMRSARKPS